MVPLTDATYLGRPTVEWTFQIPGSNIPGGRAFRKNNAVVSSSDGTVIYATLDDGSLLLLDPTSQADAILYEPTPITGRYTEGRGGLSVKEGPDGPEFIVYSIIDTPASFSVVYDNAQEPIGNPSGVTR